MMLIKLTYIEVKFTLNPPITLFYKTLMENTLSILLIVYIII